MWHPDPDQLALAALPAEASDPQVVAHLDACGRCQGRVASLCRTVALAQAGGTDSGLAAPPARVWQAVADELGEELAPAPAPVRNLGEHRSRSPWRRWALPAATAAAGLVAGLLIGLASTGSPPATTLAQVPLAPLAAAGPATSGTADVVESGGVREVKVAVIDPAGAPSGAYLEAWLMDAAGTRLYSLGALAPDADGRSFRGTFPLPADLALDQFGTVDVSAEPLDGNPAHSGASLLRGGAT